MMPAVAQIWRHPIKAHGREPLAHVALSTGQTMPWDRAWAVVHEASTADGRNWVPCTNFSRGAKAPQLMAISAELHEGDMRLTLRHPDLPDLDFSPDEDPQALIDWVKPLMPEGRAQSARLIRARERGMTDTDFPSISIGNLATHAAIEEQLGQELSILRWRANLWLDGLAPWEEFNWIGRSLRIGSAELLIREKVTRCMATTANPATGQRDADTLGALKRGWDHQDFCVYAEVTRAGDITTGAAIEVI